MVFGICAIDLHRPSSSGPRVKAAIMLADVHAERDVRESEQRHQPGLSGEGGEGDGELLDERIRDFYRARDEVEVLRVGREGG